MAVAQGFSKITTSGSVFMYDTADGVNSFKGKPATNILQGITPGQSSSPPLFVVSYGTESVYIPGLGKSVTANYCNIYNDYNGGSGACCPSLFNFGSGFTAGVTGSTTYTYQIIYRTADGYYSTNYMYRYEYGPSGYITEGGFLDPSRMEDLGDGWVHGWGSFTTNAATTNLYCYLFHYQYATQNKVQVAGIMITQGSQVLRPNQFLAPQASRSNTQSLLPLISNSTLNLTNASFNSTGEISLDGSNDYIKASQNSNFYTNNWTWEMVVKFTANTGTYQGLVWAEGDTGEGSGLQYLLTLYSYNNFHYRVYNNSTTWAATDTAAITFNPSQYNHIIWQFNNGTVYIYVNGTLFHTDTSRGAYSGGTNSPMFIGARNDGAYGAPMMPAVYRHYTRVLTPGEILNNYNHYKTKYNLP